MEKTYTFRVATGAKTLCKVFFFCFIIALGAKIRVPLFFSPVPITLQTLSLFLAIFFLGEKAFFSAGLYVLLGGIGFPFFSFGGGFLYFLSPTGGYIAGFVVASIFGGLLLNYHRSLRGKFFILAICNLIIYVCGISWLVVGYGHRILGALQIGAFPFILPDALKIILVLSLGKIFKK